MRIEARKVVVNIVEWTFVFGIGVDVLCSGADIADAWPALLAVLAQFGWSFLARKKKQKYTVIFEIKIKRDKIS